MSDEQKPAVDVPEVANTDATATAPAAESHVATDAAPAADAAKSVDETKPVDASDVAKADDKKDEAHPVDEGHLAHKAQGASFPKNLIPSKEFFFFGSDAVEPKTLAHYQKSEKSAETAHANVAWASHTGKGLLFVGDRKAPTGVINLAHASEPEIDGSNKFHFTAKGNKHSFKAASAPERDSWVAQLKLKIAEAKELATTVTESEAYKKTLESLKPAAIVAKEDKPAEDAPKAEEPKADETAKEGEAAKEEVKDEEPKRRSASRKRASFFNFGGKKDDKKEERKSEDVAATEPAVVDVDEVPVADVPVAAADDKPTEEVPTAESPKEKPAAQKRNSFFGGVFSKKEKKAVEATKATDETPEIAADNETTTDAVAPVIPPVESTTPLAVDVSNPATVPTETVETPATQTEAKKDIKEKRKSSLPFAFGKRDKSPVPADNDEKSGISAFSKLRATIKGKAAAKAEEKPAEEGIKDETATTEPAKEAASTEGAVKETTSAQPSAAQPDSENKPENVAATAPAVTAAA